MQTHEHTVLVTPKSIMEEFKNLESEGWIIFQATEIEPSEQMKEGGWRIMARRPISQ